MRVLFVRLSAMGDVVQALGAMRSLAAARPDCRLAVVTQAPFAPLFDHVEFAVEVIPHDRSGGFVGYRKTARALRGFAPEVAIDLQGNWKAAGLAWASRAKRRIGIAGAARREPSSAWLLNERVRDPSAVHPAAAALAAVRALAPEAPRFDPELHAAAVDVEAEARVIQALGLDPTAPFRILIVTDPRDPRCWPHAAMRREAAASELPVVWLAGPDEVEVALPDGAIVVRHERGALRRLVALGVVCARAGGDVIGPDQGASHVLAATGAPCRVLFGPQDPARTKPPAATAWIHPTPPDCAPCHARSCRHPDGAVCMDFTSLDGVRVDG